MNIILLIFTISFVTLAGTVGYVPQTIASIIPGDLIPDDDTIGPVGNTGAEYKFDDGFYQKIQDLVLQVPQDGDPSVHDGQRYYNVIIVASRDDGDDRDPDETASENKDAIVKRLGLIGARDIAAAESLSFVTASIPVADIPGFSLHDEVYAIGDGEMPVTLNIDTARQTIHATESDISAAAGRTLNGTGIVVAVLDSGIDHDVALNPKVLKRVLCSDTGCRNTTTSSVLPIYQLGTSSHGSRVAQVLAASGLPTNNGIAPGVELLDVMVIQLGTVRGVAHGLDWSLQNGADVVNMSFGVGSCGVFYVLSLVANEAVDKGMVAVAAAGNDGYVRSVSYESILNPACAANVITVGGIDDRTPNTITMFINASRGPAGLGSNVLKPEVVAPAVNIQTIKHTRGTAMNPVSGTSFAAPQVSATAAMLLEARPDLTPVEIKASILLGANWTGPVPCTSVQYEQSNPSDGCSYARQPSSLAAANNAASLEILNNVGFGILDVAQTMEYALVRNTTHNHILGDYIDAQIASRYYYFTVSDTSEPVKVILSWFAHPHGGIVEQLNRHNFTAAADLDFTIMSPQGAFVTAQSSNQTNEFAVFMPPVTGTYTVKVTASDLGPMNKPVQNYAIASTHSLTTLPTLFNNNPPSAESRTVTINPNQTDPLIIRLYGTDPDGDPISFSISNDPDHGTVSTDEFITGNVSRVLYTPDSTFVTNDTFEIVPQDGFETGTAANVTVVSESLPPGSADIQLDTSNIRNWSTLWIDSEFDQKDYTETFSGPSYAVSALYVGSANMEGTDLTIATTGGDTYTVAIPANGSRMIEFSPSITIRSATLSADGIDEEAAHNNLNDPLSSDVRVFVGYVPSSCTGVTRSVSVCSVYATYTATSSPGLEITHSSEQDAASTINVPVHGNVSSLSVAVNITHTYIGNLKIILNAPDGTNATLHDRQGGATDDIITTYTSSISGLAALAGSNVTGDWTIYVEDHASGNSGTFNDWTLVLTYLPRSPPAVPPDQQQTTLFSDDFESSLSQWTETGRGDWTISTSVAHQITTLPGHSASNMVLHADGCSTSCTLTLKDSIDLTAYDSATLSFWRFVDSALDTGEYLKVEAYDGSTWSTIFDWSHSNGGDDNTWNQESYDLLSYLSTSDFKVRLVTKQSSIYEDVQLDDLTINATSGGSGTDISNISEDFESGLGSWTQDGDSDWITRSPTVQVPNSVVGNTVAYSSNCDQLCTITLAPVDLSSHQSGYLVLDRYISSALDTGEYLKVGIYDGSAWTTIFDWQASSGDDDGTWHTEYYDISAFLVSGIKLNITARSSSSSEISMIDNILITDSPPGVTAPTDYAIYVADTDDKEVLVFAKNGTYQGVFVSRGSGGLGKVWDVSFGPDGHLYASDNTNYKIRKYNGATGAAISSATGWASTTGFPNGLTWNGNTLYVATSTGVEQFSSTGTSLGYFGDASRTPTTQGAPALLTPYDVTFCPDGHMYAADRSNGKILYYSASNGTYQGQISGSSTIPPNTYRAAGLACGTSLSGSGTSLYQGGDDPGRINEINPSGTLIRSITSNVDEPYGMDVDGAGVLYVANKDDDNILKITSGDTVSVFASGNRMDDPRGVTTGPEYAGTASSSRSLDGDTQNDDPEITLVYNGTATDGAVTISSAIEIRASDPDGDPITITIMLDSLLPKGAVSFTDHLNGTATVQLDTDVEAGTYVLWVMASDNQGNWNREPYAVIIP